MMSGFSMAPCNYLQHPYIYKPITVPVVKGKLKFISMNISLSHAPPNDLCCQSKLLDCQRKGVSGESREIKQARFTLHPPVGTHMAPGAPTRACACHVHKESIHCADHYTSLQHPRTLCRECMGLPPSFKSRRVHICQLWVVIHCRNCYV